MKFKHACLHGENSSNNYQKKFQCSTTSLVRTGKPQTFKLVFFFFFENMILQLLLFKNLRQLIGVIGDQLWYFQMSIMKNLQTTTDEVHSKTDNSMKLKIRPIVSHSTLGQMMKIHGTFPIVYIGASRSTDFQVPMQICTICSFKC